MTWLSHVSIPQHLWLLSGPTLTHEAIDSQWLLEVGTHSFWRYSPWEAPRTLVDAPWPHIYGQH